MWFVVLTAMKMTFKNINSNVVYQKLSTDVSFSGFHWNYFLPKKQSLCMKTAESVLCGLYRVTGNVKVF